MFTRVCKMRACETYDESRPEIVASRGWCARPNNKQAKKKGELDCKVWVQNKMAV